jgi:SLT domain-containing protein
MADATEQVLVSINGDASGLSKAVSDAKHGVKSLGEETDKAGEKATASGGKFKAGLAAAAIGATAAVAGIINFSKQSIKAYNSVQDSVQKFQMVAANAKWSQSMQSEAVKSFGVISGGASRAAATTAASMGLTGKSFETLKGPMGDLAVKFGGVAGASDQFAGISQKMARAIQTGAVSSLSRYGVVMSDAQKKTFAAADQQQRSQMVADALAKSVGGLNEKLSQTPAGQMQALSNSVAAVKTNFGGLLEGAVSPDKFIASLNLMINQGIKVFSTMAPRLIQGVAQSLPALIAALIRMIPIILSAVADAIRANGKVIVTAVTQMFTQGSVASKWITGVAASIGAIVAAYKAWTAATNLWAAAQRIAQVAQLLMNSAMLASPITWIVAGIALVVAGLVLFFTKTNVGRKIWSEFTGALVSAWNNVCNGLEAGWNAIDGAFGRGWNWVSNNVINPFKNGLGSLGNAFNGMKDMAARAFDSLKDAAATPVRWIVNVVYTNGIQKTWNGIAGAIGLNNLKLPDEHFASGGIMPGYTPGRDTMLAQVSGGEAIMRPEFTRALGADNINALNAAARSGGVQGVRGLMGYASGGIIGGAWNGVKSLASKAWDGAKSVASGVADFMSDPGKWISSNISNPVRSMLSGIGSGNWGSMLGAIPMKVVDGLVDKAKSAMDSLGAGSYKAGAGVAQWTPQVLQALSMLGQPASWLNTVLRRMNQESGGNPNARNDWDSNAKAGMPSQGLMQTIPGTFAAYAGPLAGRGILDPLANIYAGLNYAIHRYGSLDALNRAGGYARGGKHPDDELAWFNGDEYTLNADSARSLGYKSLDYMNRTGRLPQKTDGNMINVTSQSTDPLAIAQQLDRMLRTA